MQRVCATSVLMHNAWLHACARRQSTRAHTSVLASVSTHIPRLSASACSTCSLAEREVGAAAAVAVLPPPPPGAAAFGGGKEAAGTVSDARQPVSRSCVIKRDLALGLPLDPQGPLPARGVKKPLGTERVVAA